MVTLANQQMREMKALNAANALFRSERKLAVFEAVYYHKKRAKSVSEIVERSGLTRMQVLQAGGQLRSLALVDQTKHNGETAYEQKAEVMGLKTQILSLVKNPERIKKLNSERSTAQVPRSKEVSFVAQLPRRPRTSSKIVKKNTLNAKTRIGFLSTNPDPNEPLRTDKEVKEIKAEVRGAKFFSQSLIEHIPAADLKSLLQLLNDFEPDILQFSGHGGRQSLYFDDSSHSLAGGVFVDFDLINGVLSALNKPPRLLVFSACDTLDGAEQFLESSQAVIAMSSSIGDSSAIVFSANFYSALLSGQNLESALQQGKILLKAMGKKDADFPTVITKDDISPRDIKFFNSTA